MEAMIAAGKELGLGEDSATTLTLQTAAGAAQMALDADVAVMNTAARHLARL